MASPPQRPSDRAQDRPQDPIASARTRVGQTLCGKWLVDRLIDTGGMAAVYQATHRNGKRVAIKMLFSHISANTEVRERFLREGYVANKVDHPGAVSVLDDDITEDGAVFLVMELLEGETLETWLTRAGGKLRAADVLAVADQALDVLAAAHAKGVVHRDIKPGNLFSMRTGQIKVLDFGLARLLDSKLSGAATAVGTVMGTASYMPPEQARGRPDMIDPRTDIYALGSVMFRALTGRFVHDKARPDERLFAAMKEPAPKLLSVMPNAPPEIAVIIDRALEFEQSARWPSAAEMRAAVRQAYEDVKDRARTVVEEPESVRDSEIIEVLSEFLEEDSSFVVELSFGSQKKSPDDA